MKSREISVLLHVLDGLITDACLAYPALKGSFLKDKERIALYSKTRGLAFFTLDLPALGSLLLVGLESGCLSLSGPLSKRVSKRIHVPRLLSGLWLQVFSKSACLKSDPDITAVAFLRQFCDLGKKLFVECSQERINATLKGYHDVEKELRFPSLRWDNDVLDVKSLGNLALLDCLDRSHDIFDEADSLQDESVRRSMVRDQRLLEQCQRVADMLVNDLGHFNPVTYSYGLEICGLGVGFKHGPGAVAEKLKNPEKSGFPNWPHKLEGVFPFALCGKTARDTRERPLNHELPSRLICVPKTAKGPRLIAAEPVAQQWCQQIMWKWLQSRLRWLPYGAFVDFRRQSLSGDMVLSASLDRKLATVDLSDASDRLSCWTVERMFRRNTSVLVALHAARTRWLHDNISGVHSFLRLKKFASQGTATTFPIQSIVFLIIAIASAIGDEQVTISKIKKLSGSVRVFGDDIILPTHGYVRLCRIMELLQLKVNVAKSYVHGHFRESCGTDGYLGSNVTSVKPKVIVADGPASCQAVIDTTNNLHLKGYWHASHNLLSTIPLGVKSRLRVVGVRDVGFAGLSSFSGSDESHLRTRWNSRLHRNEGRIWRLSPVRVNRDRQGHVPLLDFFASAHNPWNPRIVSTYGLVRKIRSDLSWEPLNDGAHGSPMGPRR